MTHHPLRLFMRGAALILSTGLLARPQALAGRFKLPAGGKNIAATRLAHRGRQAASIDDIREPRDDIWA